jgi:hypothetical protein
MSSDVLKVYIDSVQNWVDRGLNGDITPTAALNMIERLVPLIRELYESPTGEDGCKATMIHSSPPGHESASPVHICGKGG